MLFLDSLALSVTSLTLDQRKPTGEANTSQLSDVLFRIANIKQVVGMPNKGLKMLC